MTWLDDLITLLSSLPNLAVALQWEWYVTTPPIMRENTTQLFTLKKWAPPWDRLHYYIYMFFGVCACFCMCLCIGESETEWLSLIQMSVLSLAALSWALIVFFFFWMKCFLLQFTCTTLLIVKTALLKPQFVYDLFFLYKSVVSFSGVAAFWGPCGT